MPPGWVEGRVRLWAEVDQVDQAKVQAHHHDGLPIKG